MLGREDAGITVDDAELSRRHAVVRIVDGRVEIEDLGSLNGTFVNGEQISGTRGLAGGDTIRIGATVFMVEARSAATVVTPRPVPPPPAPAPSEPILVPERREAPAEPFGHYGEHSTRRPRIASRQLTPELFTVASIVGTAVALALYFGLR